MGLLRAAIIFIAGNFTISILNKNLDQIKTVPILGNVFGNDLIKIIKKNEMMCLLVVLTLVEFII